MSDFIAEQDTEWQPTIGIWWSVIWLSWGAICAAVAYVSGGATLIALGFLAFALAARYYMQFVFWLAKSIFPPIAGMLSTRSSHLDDAERVGSRSEPDITDSPSLPMLDSLIDAFRREPINLSPMILPISVCFALVHGLLLGPICGASTASGSHSTPAFEGLLLGAILGPPVVFLVMLLVTTAVAKGFIRVWPNDSPSLEPLMSTLESAASVASEYGHGMVHVWDLIIAILDKPAACLDPILFDRSKGVAKLKETLTIRAERQKWMPYFGPDDLDLSESFKIDGIASSAIETAICHRSATIDERHLLCALLSEDPKKTKEALMAIGLDISVVQSRLVQSMKSKISP